MGNIVITKPKLQIYIDMDGVVSDFKGTYFQLLESYKAKDEWKFFNKMVLEENLFSILDPLPNAGNLIHYIDCLYAFGIIEEPKFLTSVADISGERHAAQAFNQKESWVRKHLGVTWEVIPVLSKANKKAYATENAFLIDDTESNINEFEDAGGNGFLYADVDFEYARLAIDNWIDYKTSVLV